MARPSASKRARRRAAPAPSALATLSPRPTIWLLRALVLLLAVCPFLGSLTAGYTLDDLRLVVQNPMVQGAEPALHLLTWVDRPENYRPLTMLSFALNRRLGAAASGFHVVNVILHALVTLLVFEIAWLVLGSSLGATAAGALFAVHPIHTEAVTSVVGRAEVLAALFVLLALLALARATVAGLDGRRRLGWRGVSLAAFGAGLLCKESALTAVALCAVVHWWVSRERRLGRTLREVAPHVVLGIAYLAWRRYLIGALGMPELPHFIDNPLAYVVPLSRVATALVVLVQDLGLLVWPVVLSSDYSFNQVPVVTDVLDPRLLVAAGVLALVIIVLVASLRRAPEVAVAGAFLFVPMVVTANIFIVIGTIKAERLLYLPSLGWCLAAAWLVMEGVRRWRYPVLGALAAVLCLLAVRTYVRNQDWRDNETAHAVAVRTAPASAKTHYNRGRDLLEHRQLAEAIREFRRSVEIYPSWPEAQANLGGALALIGNLPEALAHLTEASRLEPGNAATRINLAQVLMSQGRIDEAIEQLRETRRVAPALTPVSRLLARLYAQHGRLPEAVEELSAAAAADPRDPDTQNELGVVLFRLGQVGGAIRHFERALALKADHPQAQQNLRAALAAARPATR